MYVKVTELTFKREDRRPLVACYICHARLQNCYRLRTSCLQSEELLTEMLTSSELVPQQVFSTNTLRVESVLHFSLGHLLQNSTECHIKKEATGFVHDAEFDQQNTKGIKIEPQEEPDAQKDDDIQCSYLEDPLDVMERIPDNVETDAEDIKLVMDDIIIEENKLNGASQSSLSVYNICPKIVKVVLERMVLNDTIPSPDVPAVKKLAETDLTEPVNVHKSNVKEKLIAKSNNKFHKHRHNKVTAHDEGRKEKSRSNIGSIKKCFRSKAHLESDTCNQHDLARPMYTHTGTKPYTCGVCKKHFSRQYSLEVHLPKHTGEKRFQCDVCIKCFARERNLTQHIMNVHISEKRFQCDICNKCFRTKYYLMRHMNIHFIKKLLQCNMCNKCFTNKSNLTQHLYTHTGEKRFQCDICNKCFTSKFNLTQHVYTHTGEKQFQCDMCNKCFSHKSNLTQHVNTHASERRFQCDTCSKYLRNKSNLKLHIKTHISKKQLKGFLPK